MLPVVAAAEPAERESDKEDDQKGRHEHPGRAVLIVPDADSRQNHAAHQHRSPDEPAVKARGRQQREEREEHRVVPRILHDAPEDHRYRADRHRPCPRKISVARRHPPGENAADDSDRGHRDCGVEGRVVVYEPRKGQERVARR
jgi:hypothetical protein